MSTEKQSTELAAVENAVTSMNALTAGLADLSKRFKGVVYDVTTTKGMAEAKAARKEIAGPRIEVEKIRKAAKAPILELGRKLDAEAARITKELESLEDPIDQQITAEENRIKAEREAVIKAEQDRVAGIRLRIDGMQKVAQLAAAATASGEILELLSMVEAVVVDNSFCEFKDEATAAKAQVVEQLHKIHDAAIAREEETRKLAAERADIARLRAEQDERDRLAREAQARVDAFKGRVAAIRNRVELAQACRTSGEIASHMVAVSSIGIGPVEFGEFMQDAMQAQLETLNRLQILHTAAKDREAEQARLDAQREAQAAEQRRIDQQRAEIEASQRREREERETRERQEREAAERKAAQERAEADERERRAEQERAALAQMRMDEIMSMGHQVMIATGGRLGVRKGGTRECIVETLAETEAWTVNDEKFGPLTPVAAKMKADVIEKIRAELQRWDAHEAEQERLRNYVPTLAEMTAVLADHYQRDAETVEKWLRDKFSSNQKKGQAPAERAA